MKQLKKLRNKLWEIFRDFADSPYLIFAILFFMLMVMSLIAGLHKNEAKQLQDQLEIQKWHTSWFKMESERNGIALQECAIENKEHKRKLEEIKSILFPN